MVVHLKTDESLNEDLKIWRYMDLAKLISLLEKSAIWLARADTFKDRHEGRFPESMLTLTEKVYEGLQKKIDPEVKNAYDLQDYLVKNTFISCWHNSVDESLAMWEIYGRDTNSVAIQTTVGHIKRSINTSGINGNSLILKPVEYKMPKDVQGVLRYEECFFIKRPHFAFEKEVRISLDTYSITRPTKNTPLGYPLKCSIKSLIEAIYTHPDSADWFNDVIDSIKNRYEIDAVIKRGVFGNN